MTVGGTPLIVHIVGRAVEPDQDGEVLSFGLDSLAAKDAVPPQFYSLVLRPGADPAEVRGPAAGRLGRGPGGEAGWSTRPSGSRSSGW